MSKPPIRVAVVDDEPSVRRALARLLSASSFEAKTYGSAEEFIESIRGGVPECLVVDIHMPELTGLDLQRYLVRAGLKIPTIVITAFNDVETREQCAAIGAIAFLTKPLHGPTLIETVRKAAARCEPGTAGHG